MLSDLSRLIDQVSKDKGIEKKIVTEAIVQGLLSAARKKYGTYRDIEAKYNDEIGELELFEFKTVIKDDDFVDDQIEIKLSDALKLDPEAQEEDQIGVRLETKDLGRIDAHTARQIISQSIRIAEHQMIFNEFEKRKGEVVGGIVRRVERGAIVVDLDKTESYIPRREQILGEKYKPGDRIQGYILEVEQTTRGPQIIMSRAHPEYLIKLFESEVPEIYEGIVKIKKAAREAGHRAKIAVYSLDSAVHPVGACVGMKGSRVQNITQELKGERIDVVIWDENPVQFVCNALAPAKIAKVFVDEENRAMEVVVPDDQLSLAIGKRGQNVRLAVQLTEWKIDILSEQGYEERRKHSLFNLQLIPQVSESQAQNIFQSGVQTVQELQALSVERIQNIPGYESEEKAQALIQAAKDLVMEYKKQNKEFEIPPSTEEEVKNQKQLGAQAQADLRLKREMERLKSDDEESSDAESKPDENGESENQKEAVSAQESEDTPTQQKEAVSAQESEDAPAQQKEAVSAQESEDASAQKEAVSAQESEDTPAQQKETVSAQESEDAPAQKEAVSAQESEDAPAQKEAVSAQESEDAPAQQKEAVSAQESEDASAQKEAVSAQESEDTPTQQKETVSAQESEDAPAQKEASHDIEESVENVDNKQEEDSSSTEK